MTTTERLQRIRTKCVELLEIAEKRTPSAWFNDGDLIDTSAGVISCDTGFSSENNAAFIAACAGPAEAGWKATIAAISWLETAHISVYKPEREEAERVTRDILAAWPEELL
jgi:hypothetical protein